jgi:hypothetical protein
VCGGNNPLICRDGFCCAAKRDLERGAIKVLCFYYFVDGVNYHSSGFDQRETKDHVHAPLGSISEDIRGLASILGEIRQVKLK